MDKENCVDRDGGIHFGEYGFMDGYQSSLGNCRCGLKSRSGSCKDVDDCMEEAHKLCVEKQTNIVSYNINSMIRGEKQRDKEFADDKKITEAKRIKEKEEAEKIIQEQENKKKEETKKEEIKPETKPEEIKTESKTEEPKKGDKKDESKGSNENKEDEKITN